MTLKIWLPNQQEAFDLAVGDGSIILVAIILVAIILVAIILVAIILVGRSLDDNWQSTFVVPRYVLDENPGLTSVQDLRKFKDLFVTPDNNGTARLITCVVGWECAAINARKIAAYGLADVIELVPPQSETALFA